MEIKNQIEALARLDGYRPIRVCGVIMNWKAGSGDGEYHASLPTYESHDDLQRIIDGLDRDKDELSMYSDWLLLIVAQDKDLDHCKDDAVDETYVATPAQKREAILKAKGLYE